MMQLSNILAVFAIVMFLTVPLPAEGPAIADPSQVDADYAIQGEYTGTTETDNRQIRVGAQVIALGGGQFRSVGYYGGLPGGGWNMEQSVERTDGEVRDGIVTFQGSHARGTLESGIMTLVHNDGRALGKMQRVVRQSPTIGAKPPASAIVLFDGSSIARWDGAGDGAAHMSGGLLHQGVNSKQKFQDHRLHIEFRLPYQPQDRGQQRGNSGVYLQGRYEVQVLDSFGLEGKSNECGGIYEFRDPDVNMCFPPLTWQTYDIGFTAAQFDDDGEKTANARITVRHNGVLVHDDVEVPRSTRAAPLREGPTPGFIHLQDHGNPVRFRNIWAVPGGA
jgi:hypothetical protein